MSFDEYFQFLEELAELVTPVESIRKLPAFPQMKL
jgi:hypothetical protein